MPEFEEARQGRDRRIEARGNDLIAFERRSTGFGIGILVA
jgi:hypothetical protein